MRRQRLEYSVILVVGLVLIALLALAVGVWGYPSDTKSAAAAGGVLVLVAALAVGIERVLEFFWTAVDQFAASPFWPLNAPARALQNLANNLNPIVQPLVDQVNQILSGWPKDPTKTAQQLAAARSEVDALLRAVNAAAADPSVASGLQGVKDALARVDKVIGDPAVTGSVAAAAVGIDGLSSFVSSLLDNPGRRVLSILVACLLGLAAAWWLGLDVVHAALNAPLPTRAGLATISQPHTLQWGMVATGLAIGLGSGPTHEIIKAIQAYKQAQLS
jgi:ElaB/YqjD/DUF883 family membrane-anchored ribosome-binding protein